MECGDLSPLSFSNRFSRSVALATANRREKESGDKSPHSKDSQPLSETATIRMLLHGLVCFRVEEVQVVDGYGRLDVFAQIMAAAGIGSGYERVAAAVEVDV